MKAISFVEAKDIIGGALNPFAGLVKGAQLGYDTGASIMGMVGGVVGGILGGAMGFPGCAGWQLQLIQRTGRQSCKLSISKAQAIIGGWDPFAAALQGASAGYNAGSQMLGALGGTIGGVFGPVGGFIGGFFSA